MAYGQLFVINVPIAFMSKVKPYAHIYEPKAGRGKKKKNTNLKFLSNYSE